MIRINHLHEVGHTFDPKAGKPTPGSGDLCFIAEGTMREIVAYLGQCRIAIVDGPVMRTGSTGPIESVYIRDPDANLIELSRYPAAS